MPTKKTASLLSALALALLCAAPASAAKLGPYFPLPESFDVAPGAGKESLLKLDVEWLETGLKNLEKARQETNPAEEEKLKSLDAEIASTREELALAKNDDDLSKETQIERKRKLLLNVNQWIREIGRQATQQLKISVLKDGAEAETAQNQHIRLSELADRIESAKHEDFFANWARK